MGKLSEQAQSLANRVSEIQQLGMFEQPKAIKEFLPLVCQHIQQLSVSADALEQRVEHLINGGVVWREKH